MGLENGFSIEERTSSLDENKKIRLSVKCAQFEELMRHRGVSAEEVARKIEIFRKMILTKEEIVARLAPENPPPEEDEEEDERRSRSESRESERSPPPKKRSSRRRRRRRERSLSASDKDDVGDKAVGASREKRRSSKDGADPTPPPPTRPHPKPSLLGTPPPHAHAHFAGMGMPPHAFGNNHPGVGPRGRGRGPHVHPPSAPGSGRPSVRPPSLMSQNSGAASLLNSGALGALNRPDLTLQDRDKIAAALIDDEAELMARELAKSARGRAEVIEKKRGIRRNMIGGTGGNNIIGHPGQESSAIAIQPQHGEKCKKFSGCLVTSARPLRQKSSTPIGGGTRGPKSFDDNLSGASVIGHGPNMSNKLPGIKANLIGPRGNPWRWSAAAEAAAKSAAGGANRSDAGRFSRSPPPTHHRSSFTNRGTSRSRSRSGSRSRY